MKKTDNYHLSQWDLSDPIKMDDFNADNKAIEAALTNLAALAAGGAQADALAAARAELEAAIAAERERVNAELAKRALASDLTSAKSSLESSISKLETNKAAFVTIWDTTAASNVRQYVNLYTAGLNLEQYAVVSLELGDPSQSCTLSVNGQGTCFFPGSSAGSNGYVAGLNGPSQTLLFPMKNSSGLIRTVTFSGYVCFGTTTIPYSELEYFQVKGDSVLSKYFTVRVRGIK